MKLQEALQAAAVVPRSALFCLAMLINYIFVTKHCTSRMFPIRTQCFC